MLSKKHPDVSGGFSVLILHADGDGMFSKVLLIEADFAKNIEANNARIESVNEKVSTQSR